MRRFPPTTDAHLSLLQNRSPPSSPLGALQDTNVASIYAGSAVGDESSSTGISGRFEAQEEKSGEPELDPQKDGALQFVPAYEEASWDAIITDEKKVPDPPSSIVARAQNYKRSRLAAAQRHQQRMQQQQQQPSKPQPNKPQPASKSSLPSSTKQQPSKPQTNKPQPQQQQQQQTQRGNRISRLASLFSSRATVQEEQQKQPQQETPASPSHSGASSGYVGWPGTQDARGATVTVQSSYDDSSAGGPAAKTATADTATAATTTTKRTSQPVSVDAFAEETQSDVVVEQQTGTSLSAIQYAQSEIGTSSRQYRERLAQRAQRRALEQQQQQQHASPVASASSSAYMKEEDLEYPVLDDAKGAAFPSFRASSASAPPTVERLAANDRLAPPPRTFHAAKGYQGLIDKTKEVPCLMDVMDSDSSSRATSAYSSSRKQTDTESDVFDGISLRESEVFDGLESPRRRTKSFSSNASLKKTYPRSIAEEQEQDDSDFKLVLLGGGLSAIQSTSMGFSNRQTASDFDENLTNSEVDQHGFARLPGFHEMMAAGRKDRDSSLHGIQGNFQNNTNNVSMISANSDDGSSLFTDPYDQTSCLDVGGDLWEYYVHPRLMKKVVRKYRRMSELIDTEMTLEEFEREEDEHKAFALFEMRSRVMEKDIERGLERRGGTVAVDDLVTTPYYRTSQRVRDACIVSKAWRDGASPADVINSAQLTRRHPYFIKRPVRSMANDSMSSAYSTTGRRYTLEQVEWVDDTDFALYRCPSLGARHMRGFEMFTVGDCQSILLKLTNEHCMNLREALNDATRRQIEAEDFLHLEGDAAAGDTMTLAEMTYLEAMEDVKTISKRLVEAEKAFSLVKDRIQDLVTRYQALLVKIEAESCAGASSIMTFESSYSDNDSEYWEEQEHLERERWARRAKRAEVRAELAAREALMVRQEARMIQEEKERELEALQQKLFELQSEPSTAIADKEQSAAAIAKNYSMHRNDAPHQMLQPEVARSTTSRTGIDKEKLDGVKQRFRDRIAAKKKQANGFGATTMSPPGKAASPVTPSPQQTARTLFRSAGEEMYQHLDFYERSLKAVEMTHDPI